MEWYELSVLTTSESVEAVSNILVDREAKGVQIEDSKDFEHLKKGKYGKYGEIIDPDSIPHIKKGAIVSAYFPESSNISSRVPEISQKVLELKRFGLNPGPGEVKLDTLKSQDWATAWEKYYHPLRITRFLTVVPKWENYSVTSHDEKVIYLDPGMAFGTGTHPTTRLSLEMLETVLRGNESVIDVGTGSGVLSIAAKLMSAADVFAYDVDEVAVKSAKKNFALNDSAKDIHLGVNNLLSGIHKQVDVVVANILAEIIIPLTPQAFDNLKPGGYFLTSGIINSKFGLVVSSLKSNHFKIVQTLKMKDWCGIIAQKPSENED